MTRIVSFTRMDPTNLTGAETEKSLYMVHDEQGQGIGLVASAEVVTKPGNRSYTTLKWGFAVHGDEFKSGLQHPYSSRKHATKELARQIALISD